MICLLVTKAHRYTLDDFFESWARSLHRRCAIVTYDSLPHRAALSAASFVFTDLERLTDRELEHAAALAERIEQAGGRILNRPDRVLRRFNLLRKLHADGDNPFDVFRLPLEQASPRFPVFIREENEHTGSLTPLLHNRAELDAAFADVSRSHRGKPLLAVEYHDSRAADGMFRKYSAMRVGDAILPRHVLFSEDWVDKKPDVINDATVAEEDAFLTASPHQHLLPRPFVVAGIDFGRIDYAMDGQRVVTWEINTNPVIVPVPEKCNARRIAGALKSAKQIAAAISALDGKDVLVDLLGLPSVATKPFRSMLLRSASRAWRAGAKLPITRSLLHSLRYSLEMSKQRV